MRQRELIRSSASPANSPLKKCFESNRESISFRLPAANAVNPPDFQVKPWSNLDGMGRVLGQMTFFNGLLGEKLPTSRTATTNYCVVIAKTSAIAMI